MGGLRYVVLLIFLPLAGEYGVGHIAVNKKKTRLDHLIGRTKGAFPMNTLKTGSRIELHGAPAIDGIFPGAPAEMATIARWTAISGPRDKMPGWHIVKFADGGRLCIHESRFRIIDNR
jgi:hypothetical protein